MRKFSLCPLLRKVLSKIVKRDRETYEAVIKKIEEILASPDVDHYKNLRSPLQEYKRVHINGPFVLIFQYDPKNDTLFFYDLDHHDRIYNS